ncbi:Ras GTPase-activating protein-binding protein [Abortiporus biennis]
MTNTTVNPSEVGWQFVPQYYTFVNKQPSRLHCFYTKASTFIHGTEGEDGKACFGQQEIHARITQIGFQDCKVFIHSVDAQSSANGGIIIQVIGEMSNAGEPWRKFVQTFFLAEQPNGYFVLNDIFRFLKEETVDEEQGDEDVGQEVPAVEPEAPPPAAPATPAPAPPQAEPEPEVVRTPTPPVPVVEETSAPPEPEPQSEPQANGVHEPVEAPEPAVATPEPVATASPPPVSPAAPAHQPLASSSAAAPVVQPPHPTPPATTTAPAPAPAAPAPRAPQPKTWANLAAANPTKWGSAVAQEIKGISEAPASTSSPAPTSSVHSPAPHARPQQHHPAYTAALNVTTPHCFVKGVIETVSDAGLKSVLTQRFGSLVTIEIVRSKACAFLEFSTVDSARRAIAASLPTNQGGEGGIRIGAPGDNNAPRIVVETRKERNERPPPRGAPNGGDTRGRGGYRGSRGGPGGPGGRGRGGNAPSQSKA